MKKYISFFLIMVFHSCSWTGTKKIVDNYEISWGDYYTQGRNGYCLYCNPRCDGDLGIDDIRSIIWNKSIILIEKNNDNIDRWYMVKAKGDSLQCCNDDTIIRNMKKEEIDSVIERYKYLNLDTLTFVK